MRIVDAEILLIGPRAVHVATGVALAFELLLAALHEAGIRCRVVDLAGTLVGRRIGRFQCGKALRNILQLPFVAYSLFRSRRLYLVLSTSTPGFLRDSMIIRCAALLRVPVVLHLHGGGFEHFFQQRSSIGKTWIRWTLSLVERVIVLSTTIRPQFELAGMPPERIVVVPNSLPEDVPHGLDRVLPVLPVPPDGPVQVLYLSNMISSKGYKDVIRALQLLDQRCPGRYQLQLAGEFLQTSSDDTAAVQDGSRDELAAVHDRASLERFLDQHHLQNVVHYHGAVAGHAKIRLLKSAHVLVLPTYYPWEGQPLCIIEALAYGIPVIATAYRGILDEVIPGVNGFFVDPCEPIQICDRIELLCRSADDYQAISCSAQKSYLENFTRVIHLERMFAALGLNAATACHT